MAPPFKDVFQHPTTNKTLNQAHNLDPRISFHVDACAVFNLTMSLIGITLAM
jgi:hypothetical protein